MTPFSILHFAVLCGQVPAERRACGQAKVLGNMSERPRRGHDDKY